MIYLDNAATTLQKPDSVYTAVSEAMKSCASLGRSAHAPALSASVVACRCRQAAGAFFDVAPERVVFTSNATHGLNLAIKTLVKPGDPVVISGFEHNAVVRPLTQLGAKITVVGRTLFCGDQFLSELEQALSSKPSAVICTHVSNVFGYILPIEEAADLCHKKGIPLIIDAAQSAGSLPISMERLHAAFIAMPGHKGLLGPQGTGLLLCGMAPKPILEGGTGSQSVSPLMPDYLPDCAEAGTHNIPGIAGLLAGLEYLQNTGLQAVRAHEMALLDLLLEQLQQTDAVRIFSGSREEQAGVLSLQFLQNDCEQAAQRLADYGIAVRAGLHCAPLAHESAGTLESGTVRISVSPFTTAEDILGLTDLLPKILPQTKK